MVTALHQANACCLPVKLRSSIPIYNLTQKVTLMSAVHVMQDEEYIKSTSDKLPDVGKKMEYMLNTGNLVSKTGLDISQATGFTVVAEKLNFFR